MTSKPIFKMCGQCASDWWVACRKQDVVVSVTPILISQKAMSDRCSACKKERYMLACEILSDYCPARLPDMIEDSERERSTNTMSDLRTHMMMREGSQEQPTIAPSVPCLECGENDSAQFNIVAGATYLNGTSRPNLCRYCGLSGLYGTAIRSALPSWEEMRNIERYCDGTANPRFAAACA